MIRNPDIILALVLSISMTPALVPLRVADVSEAATIVRPTLVAFFPFTDYVERCDLAVTACGVDA